MMLIANRKQQVGFRVARAGTLRLDVLIAEKPRVNMANKTYGTVSPERQRR